MVAYTYYPPLLLISPPECLTTSSSIKYCRIEESINFDWTMKDVAFIGLLMGHHLF